LCANRPSLTLTHTVIVFSSAAGDYASSIFSLLPQAHLYPASGINANLQWCGVGFSQLPNGIGFGGQVR
jgi:hypothetical protein